MTGKASAWILVLVLLISLTACSAKPAQKPAEKGQTDGNSTQNVPPEEDGVTMPEDVFTEDSETQIIPGGQGKEDTAATDKPVVDQKDPVEGIELPDHDWE